MASLTTTSLAIGTHSIIASFVGDSGFAPSTSPTVSETVAQDATVVTVSPSQNPTMVTSSVTFTVAVAGAALGGGAPTGMVTLRDGSTTLATLPLDTSAQAGFSTSSLALGSHSITASYDGDGNFLSGASSALTVLVSALTVSFASHADISLSNALAAVMVTDFNTDGKQDVAALDSSGSKLWVLLNRDGKVDLGRRWNERAVKGDGDARRWSRRVPQHGLHRRSGGRSSDLDRHCGHR